MISAGTFAQISVASGTSCTLEGSVVVEGDVVADGAVDVTIDGIDIDGSVEIKHSTGAILIQDSQIDDNIKLKGNRTDASVFLESSAIAASGQSSEQKQRGDVAATPSFLGVAPSPLAVNQANKNNAAM